MIAEFPGCGVYSTAFNIVSHDGRFPARTPSERGNRPRFAGGGITRLQRLFAALEEPSACHWKTPNSNPSDRLFIPGQRPNHGFRVLSNL